MRPQPSEEEVLESGSCFRCRSDWGKEGALCAHCKREGLYDAYFYSLFTHRRQRHVQLAQVRGIADSAADDPGAGAQRGNQGEAFLEDAPLLRLLATLPAWIGAQASASHASLASGGGSGGGGAGGGFWAGLAADAARELELLKLLKSEIKTCRAVRRPPIEPQLPPPLLPSTSAALTSAAHTPDVH